MNDTKRIGRPLAFNREEALAEAIKVFWRKGYDGASMKDLTSAMDINAPSLYASFGNKHALYLESINAYASNTQGCAPLIAFESEPEIRSAVRAFLVAAIDYATSGAQGARGCFLASCVATTAGEVEGVESILNQVIQDTDNRLAVRFESEKAKGNLSAHFPSLERARLMFDLRQGFVLRARAGISQQAMEENLDCRVDAVLNL